MLQETNLVRSDDILRFVNSGEFVTPHEHRSAVKMVKEVPTTPKVYPSTFSPLVNPTFIVNGTSKKSFSRTPSYSFDCADENKFNEFSLEPKVNQTQQIAKNDLPPLSPPFSKNSTNRYQWNAWEQSNINHHLIGKPIDYQTYGHNFNRASSKSLRSSSFLNQNKNVKNQNNFEFRLRSESADENFPKKSIKPEIGQNTLPLYRCGSCTTSPYEKPFNNECRQHKKSSKKIRYKYSHSCCKHNSKSHPDSIYGLNVDENMSMRRQHEQLNDIQLQNDYNFRPKKPTDNQEDMYRCALNLYGRQMSLNDLHSYQTTERHEELVFKIPTAHVENDDAAVTEVEKMDSNAISMLPQKKLTSVTIQLNSHKPTEVFVEKSVVKTNITPENGVTVTNFNQPAEVGQNEVIENGGNKPVIYTSNFVKQLNRKHAQGINNQPLTAKYMQHVNSTQMKSCNSLDDSKLPCGKAIVKERIKAFSATIPDEKESNNRNNFSHFQDTTDCVTPSNISTLNREEFINDAIDNNYMNRQPMTSQ